MTRRSLVLAVVAFGLLCTACSGPANPSSEPTRTSIGSVAGVTATATDTAPLAVTPTEATTSTPTIAPEASATAIITPEPAATLTVTQLPDATATASEAPTATASSTSVPPTATALSLPTATQQSSSDEFIIITRDETTEKTVALTFDAGADLGYAEDILDILAAEGVVATFGMTGHWAMQYPELIERMVAEGHPLMNHTWTHRSWTGNSTSAEPLTSSERAQELTDTEDIIRDIVGVELTPYFRPPYGDYDDSVLADLEANGYSVMVMWTIDSLGWNGLSADEINERVLSRMEPGAIVLLHVGAASQDAAALPEMIAQLRAQGYRFVTIPEMVGR